MVAISDTNILLRESDDNDAMYPDVAYALTPLLGRGWVFQERLMSPRTLIFGKTQVIWQCRSARLIEKSYGCDQWSVHTDKRNLEDPIQLWNAPHAILSPDAHAPSNILIHDWHRVVYQYSRLKLTYSLDRLPAIAALAGRMSELRKNDTYIAGLWKNSLLLDLQWRTYRPQQQRIGIPVPTWSWASVLAGVQLEEIVEPTPSVKLIELVLTPLGSPHIGYMTDCSIFLEGPFVTFRHTTPETWNRRLKTQYDIPGLPLICTQSYPDIDVTNPEPGYTLLTALFLSKRKREGEFTTSVALILHEIRPGVFERHGLIRCLDLLPDDRRGLQPLEEFIASLPVGRVRIL